MVSSKKAMLVHPVGRESLDSVVLPGETVMEVVGWGYVAEIVGLLVVVVLLVVGMFVVLVFQKTGDNSVHSSSVHIRCFKVIHLSSLTVLKPSS